MLHAMYIAGNPDRWWSTFEGEKVEVGKIHAEWEFSELTAALSRAVALGAVTISHRAGVSFSSMLEWIATEKPDLLHLACHATGESLLLSNESKDAYAVKEDEFGEIIMKSCKPKLIYLNGCDTAAIADKWSSRYNRVILGNEGEIDSTIAARTAVAFYTHLGLGASVEHAAKVANLVLQSFNATNGLKNRLRVGRGHNPKTNQTNLSLPLFRLPTVIARAQPVDGKRYRVEIGIRHAPIATTSLSFLTDDDTISQECRTSFLDVVSVPSPEEWFKVTVMVSGSFRFAVMGMCTEARHAWCLQSTLTKALTENHASPEIVRALARCGGIQEEADLISGPRTRAAKKAACAAPPVH
jgi:hypothetical protein